MSVIGELIVLLGTNNTALTAGLLKAEGELKSFGATAGTTGAQTGAIFGGIGLVAVAGMGLAIKAASDFQEQMAIINTIAHQTPEELGKTGEGIRALAVSSGTSLGDLTQAYYDLLSAGIKPGAEAMAVLTLANTLGIGALATTAQTVDLLTTAINAYGLDAAGAAVATDQFALAVQDGKVTAAEIAATFADVAPLAHTAGIGIDEIAASYALLTASGVKAPEAMTQMQRAILELLKPSAALEALQKKLGVNFAAMAADKGLVVTLQAIRDAATANNVPLTDLFARVEGLNFVLGTTGEHFGEYQNELTAMGSATGTALGQAGERADTFDRQLKILGQSVGDLGISVGTGLLPPVTDFVQHLSGIVKGVTDWASANPGLASSLLPVAAAVGALGLGIALLGGPITVIVGAFILLIANIDALKRGIQAVLDLTNQVTHPGGQELPPGAPTSFGQVAPPMPTYAGSPGYSSYSFGDPRANAPWGTFNTPGFGAGQPGSPFAGPRTPIQLQHTTNVHLDGAVIAQSVERTLYNDASVYSSGFASDERPRQ